MPAAAEIIRHLRLKPHPEGGHYRETFRDMATGPDGRSVSTAIYFLLERGVVSRWHRIDAAELWHWYAGAPLDLWITNSPEVAVSRIALGSDILGGQQPQAIVPANAWQQACSRGDWTLVGCTVAPAFQFEHFEMASDALAAKFAAIGRGGRTNVGQDEEDCHPGARAGRAPGMASVHAEPRGFKRSR